MARKSADQMEKEHQNKMYFMQNTKTVEDIIQWKKGKYYSVEEYNVTKINRLGWELTDVMYSFLSIYAIGMLAFYPDKYKKTNCMIYDNKTNKRVYTNAFIFEEYKECIDLNSYLEDSEFILHYFDIGNVIPMWPGGNKDKGTVSIFDLPELYFGKKENRLWMKILQGVYKNSFLDEVENTAWLCDSREEDTNNLPLIRFDSMSEFLESICGDSDELETRIKSYKCFMARVIGIIKKRNKLLENYI